MDQNTDSVASRPRSAASPFRGRVGAAALSPLFVLISAVTPACGDADRPCPAVVLYGARVSVEGIGTASVTVEARDGDGEWFACEDDGDLTFDCARNMTGAVTLRATADDGRVVEETIRVRSDHCGPVYPPQEVTLTFDGVGSADAGIDSDVP